MALVSEEIRLRARDQFLFRSVDRIRFADRFLIFELRGKTNAIGDKERMFCNEWEEIYAVLDPQNASQSLERLDAFVRRHPDDGVSRYHAEKLRKSLIGAAD